MGIDELKEIINRNDFGEVHFDDLNEAFQKIYQNHRTGELPVLRNQIHALIGSKIMQRSVQGFAYSKPHGYPGDYEVIDKMYRVEQHTDPEVAVWDKFYHFNAAAEAVRNRKEYFKSVLSDLESRQRVQILNLACGPCRDLYEFLDGTPKAGFYFDCLDNDPNAIAFAKALNCRNLNQINFIQESIFRFSPTTQYDLIWSAGLFDYFSDSTFVKLLIRLKEGLKRGGNLIVGNFSDVNPTQAYMELMVDWPLQLRSHEKLKTLALEAGFSENEISVDQEATKVNLFLRLNKSR